MTIKSTNSKNSDYYSLEKQNSRYKYFTFLCCSKTLTPIFRKKRKIMASEIKVQKKNVLKAR